MSWLFGSSGEQTGEAADCIVQDSEILDASWHYDPVHLEGP